MSLVSAAEIATIEDYLARYHSSHAAQFGPMKTCQDPKCLEVKASIAWLEERISRRT